uniref:Uncharacterized protein n=1 Tax=Podoviridae sp. ct6BA50 TaxID=2825221 RepID=A0A8S5VG32_9CAUD|nr:MAG TPA: hypothetical protein [Podoviridae sp. ct6BA50]
MSAMPRRFPLNRGFILLGLLLRFGLRRAHFRYSRRQTGKLLPGDIFLALGRFCRCGAVFFKSVIVRLRHAQLVRRPDGKHRLVLGHDPRFAPRLHRHIGDILHPGHKHPPRARLLAVLPLGLVRIPRAGDWPLWAGIRGKSGVIAVHTIGIKHLPRPPLLFWLYCPTSGPPRRASKRPFWVQKKSTRDFLGCSLWIRSDARQIPSPADDPLDVLGAHVKLLRQSLDGHAVVQAALEDGSVPGAVGIADDRAVDDRIIPAHGSRPLSLLFLVMCRLVEVLFQPVQRLGHRAVAALLFQPLETGQLGIGDECQLRLDGLEVHVLRVLPLHKGGDLGPHLVQHPQCAHQRRGFDDPVHRHHHGSALPFQEIVSRPPPHAVRVQHGGGREDELPAHGDIGPAAGVDGIFPGIQPRVGDAELPAQLAENGHEMPAGGEHPLAGDVADGRAPGPEMPQQNVPVVGLADPEGEAPRQQPQELVHVGSAGDSRAPVDRPVPHGLHRDLAPSDGPQGDDGRAHPTAGAFDGGFFIPLGGVGDAGKVVLVDQKALEGAHPPGLLPLFRGIGHRPEPRRRLFAELAQVPGGDIAPAVRQPLRREDGHPFKGQRFHGRPRSLPGLREILRSFSRP